MTKEYPVFAEALEEAAGPEAIEGIVIGWYGGHGPWGIEDDYEEGGSDLKLPAALHGQLLTWADARPYLGYRWSRGFGGAECHPVYVWTATKVIFVHEYDGSTALVWVPRNPIAVSPGLSGGDL